MAASCKRGEESSGRTPHHGVVTQEWSLCPAVRCCITRPTSPSPRTLLQWSAFYNLSNGRSKETWGTDGPAEVIEINPEGSRDTWELYKGARDGTPTTRHCSNEDNTIKLRATVN
jgi:hypothetical protein